MGFTKRYFSKELILKQIKIGFPLSKYFNVDAYIFDDELAHQAFKLHRQGHSDKQIEEFLQQEELRLKEKK